MPLNVILIPNTSIQGKIVASSTYLQLIYYGRTAHKHERRKCAAPQKIYDKDYITNWMRVWSMRFIRRGSLMCHRISNTFEDSKRILYISSLRVHFVLLPISRISLCAAAQGSVTFLQLKMLRCPCLKLIRRNWNFPELFQVSNPPYHNRMQPRFLVEAEMKKISKPEP